MRFKQVKERMANMEVHKSIQEWMRIEMKTRRDIMALLMDKAGMKPLAMLSPTSPSSPQLKKG